MCDCSRQKKREQNLKDVRATQPRLLCHSHRRQRIGSVFLEVLGNCPAFLTSGRGNGAVWRERHWLTARCLIQTCTRETGKWTCDMDSYQVDAAFGVLRAVQGRCLYRTEDRMVGVGHYEWPDGRVYFGQWSLGCSKQSTVTYKESCVYDPSQPSRKGPNSGLTHFDMVKKWRTS